MTKKRIFYGLIMIFILLIIVSCNYNAQEASTTIAENQQEIQQQTEIKGDNGRHEQIGQPQIVQNDEAKRKADDLYRMLKHEVDTIISDNMRIGPDHYQRIADRLKELEKTAIPKSGIDEIRQKTGKIKNNNVAEDSKLPSTSVHQDTSSPFKNIEREINILYESGNAIGPEHYARLSNELDKLKQQGVDVAELKQKLEKLNPAVVDANKTVQLSFTQALDKKVFDALPDCTGQKFTTAPIDVSELYEISPLGSIGVPGHTLPTPHMYLHISAGGASSKTVPLKSPGEIYIVDVVSDQDGDGDFSMGFALCKDVFGYFKHIKQLSDEVKTVYDNTKCEGSDFNPSNLCTKTLMYKVNAGTLLGGVGGMQGNFDLGAYDYRIKLGYVNQASYGDLNATGLGRPRLLSVICPLDLFEDSVKSQLYGKVKRQAEPRCGRVMHDIKGTLQGSWFYADGRADLEWAKHLSFVYGNDAGSTAIVAVAGTISEPIKWEFSPQSSGTRNRKFSDVKADGNIYCYEGTGKIIVQLISDTELKIEYQSRGCGGNYQFVKPFVYHR